MKTDTALKVHNYIKENELIKANDMIIIGLSGGVDSMVLCDVLLLYRRSVNFRLYAAHMDHRLRDESTEDALFVAAYCDRNDIPLYTCAVDVKAEAAKTKASIEVAARCMRHSFFGKILDEHLGAKLALAHHMNDKVETILMRIFRGSSLDGLAPMPQKDRHIIRPLMCLQRVEIDVYAKQSNIKWREDKSNTDIKFTRNYIRHQVIPAIVDKINPSLVATMCNQAKSYQEDKDYLNSIAKDSSLLASKTDDGYMMADEDYIYLHPSIRKRVIKILLGKLGKKTDLYEKHISAIDELFIHRRTGAQIEISGEYEARAHAMGVELIRTKNAKIIIEESLLCLDGSTYLNTGDMLMCESVQPPTEDKLKGSKNVQYLDYLAIKGQPVVRSRARGDTIKSLGASGKKKLKDYFIDKKINRWERDYIPIIAVGNEVIWIVGYAIADEYKITKDTALAIKITYKKGDRNEQ